MQCVELGSIDIVPCDPGDIILIQGPGAGGYGNPLERPADDVSTDVRRGFVSAARARSDYGVVIDEDLAIDAAATARLRGDMSRQRVDRRIRPWRRARRFRDASGHSGATPR